MSYHTIHSVGDDGAVDDTFTSFSVRFQLPSNELLFIDFMLVQLTNVSCFQDIVASIELILSYTAF